MGGFGADFGDGFGTFGVVFGVPVGFSEVDDVLGVNVSDMCSDDGYLVTYEKHEMHTTG